MSQSVAEFSVRAGVGNRGLEIAEGVASFDNRLGMIG